MKTRHCVFALAAAGAALGAFAAGTTDLWNEHCAKCHGEDGKGQTKAGRKLQVQDYTRADVQAKFTDAEAAKTIKAGRQDKNGKTLMKPAEGLSDAEIDALVAHVRAFRK